MSLGQRRMIAPGNRLAVFESQLDDVAELAARMFDVPTAIIWLLSGGRLRAGAVYDNDRHDTSHHGDLARPALMSGRIEVVRDASRDSRFSNHPDVIGGRRIRFHATAPIFAADRSTIGTLSVLDRHPRTNLPDNRMSGLETLARLASSEVARSASHRHASDSTVARPITDVPVVSAGVTLAGTLNQRMFETSPDLMLVMDANGHYVLVSPSAKRMIGYEPRELIGRSGMAFVLPEDLPHARSEMQAARHDGLPHHFDCRCVHRNGRVVPLSMIGQWSEADRHYFLIGRDMTERVAAERRQNRAHRLEAVGQLTGGIAQDFHNLLAVIVGNIDLMLSLPAPNRETATHVRAALQAAERGAELVRGLLAFARQQPLAPKETDANLLIGSLAGRLEPALEHRIQLHVVGQPDLWPIFIDPANLEAALINLAMNARDAMPDGGHLHVITCNRTITAREAESEPELKPGQWVEITVRDSGIGMPPAVRSKAFELFFTTKKDGRGTGLGLPMVHGFVHQSGGFLTLQSTSGVGTTLSLYLPAIADAADDAALSPHEVAADSWI